VADLKEGMALEGNFPCVEIEDAKLKEQLESMQKMITFCQTNGRMPQTPEEFAEIFPHGQSPF